MNFIAFLPTLSLLVVFVTTLMACAWDIRALRIPNRYSFVVVAAFAVAYVSAPDAFTETAWHYPAGLLIIFGVTYLMYLAGMMGAGDSKFGSALALWVGLHGILPYVFWMAVMGGIVGAASLYLKKKKPVSSPVPGGWVEQVQTGRNAVPYGIAIGFGAWAALWQSGLITHQLDELLKIIHS